MHELQTWEDEPRVMVEERLPHLFHIGTQKAGSTYLYNLLRAHPDVALSFQEVGFYTRHFDRGVEWYINLFAKGRYAVDTSPKYFMQGKQAARRIKSLVTGQPPLFLLILRNPIDYVHSHYQMHCRKGYFKQEAAKYPTVPDNLVDFLERYPSYLERGRYCQILEEHWLTHFDQSQFKVVFFERFITRTDEVLREVLHFFGLRYLQLSTVSTSKNSMLRFPILYKAKAMVTKWPLLTSLLRDSKVFNLFYESYLSSGTPQLNRAERDLVGRYFSKDVERLKGRLGRDISEWGDFMD